MKVNKIYVDGYRLLKDFTLDLRDDLSLVIGKNNTGKTSLLNVMSSFLSERNPQFAFEDFHLDIQKELITYLTDGRRTKFAVPCKIELTIEIEYNEQDNLSNLSKLMVDLAPNARTVNLRFCKTISEDQLRVLKADITQHLEKLKKAVDRQQQRNRQDEARKFLSKHFSRYLSGSVTSFDPSDNENFIELFDNFADIRQVISFEYLSARRSVENRPSGKGGKTASRALSQLTQSYYDYFSDPKLDSAEFNNLALEAAIADHAFSAAYENVFKEIFDKVKQFGGPREENEQIHVVSELQPEQLLKSNTIVRYGSGNALLPEDYNGLGYLNLIAIIIDIETRLLRMKISNNGVPADINILFIEEPEAHTHPQLQSIFIQQIKGLIKKHAEEALLNLQTILTTHSAYITAASDFSDIKYLRRVGNQVQARNMTDLEKHYEENSKQYHFLKQYLTLSRAELFFADKAIFIEGDTERILMNAMIKNLDAEESHSDSKLSSENISIVEVGAYAHIFDHFIEFIGLKTLIITDIDSIIKEGGKACRVEDGTCTSNDTIKHFFSLGERNEEQQNELDELRQKGMPEKQLVKCNGVWKSSSESDPLEEGVSAIFIAYQVPEEDYHARSFEDAFIHINRSFINDNIEKFKGIKNRDKFETYDEIKGAYDLARECIKKKTHFAIDILFLGGVGSEAKWNTPLYIKEGLRWLRDVK